MKGAKALINAKGAGKIIPGLNIAAGAVEVVQGISKSEKQARKDKCTYNAKEGLTGKGFS